MPYGEIPQVSVWKHQKKTPERFILFFFFQPGGIHINFSEVLGRCAGEVKKTYFNTRYTEEIGCQNTVVDLRLTNIIPNVYRRGSDVQKQFRAQHFIFLKYRSDNRVCILKRDTYGCAIICNNKKTLRLNKFEIVI